MLPFTVYICLYKTVTAVTKINIIATFLKFTGYIHNHKILPGNIFGLILKKQDGRHRRFFLISARTFVGPLEQRVL